MKKLVQPKIPFMVSNNNVFINSQHVKLYSVILIPIIKIMLSIL